MFENLHEFIKFLQLCFEVEKKPECKFEKILKNIFSNIGKVIENTSLIVCKVTLQ